MVTTYFQTGYVALFPDQNFREGFRIAGDDLLKVVIERLVIQEPPQAPERAGGMSPRADRSRGEKGPDASAAGAPPLPGKKKVAAAAVSSGESLSQKALPRETYLASSAIRHWTDSLYALTRKDNALQATGLGRSPQASW
ncbi:hypothetical protein GCM10007880_66070 [Mesorhizobium amorphae]|uniref:virulence factor SrfB n=1 Tax=Mesorhizobium amorphae TaxID=71433 RepID=UPI00235DA522|nr:virulence factor SrfB [Mesorhizobium amorphae]GLR46089.1 hypothetical protein GCM10007880_66070 [Mesorhizobium amorphae]